MKLFAKTLLVSAFIVGISAMDTSGAPDKAIDLVDTIETNLEQTKIGQAQAAAVKNQSHITEVTCEEVQVQKASITLVDALASGDMIEGAIRVPANSDDAVIAKSLPKKDAKIIVYCWGGSCNAAMTLANRLVALGYTNISHFAGGISEWKQKNLPIA